MVEDDLYIKLFDDVEIKASKTKINQPSKHVKIWKGYRLDNLLSKQLHQDYTNALTTVDDRLNNIVISTTLNAVHYGVHAKPSN